MKGFCIQVIFKETDRIMDTAAKLPHDNRKNILNLALKKFFQVFKIAQLIPVQSLIDRNGAL